MSTLHENELRQFERLLQQQKAGNIAARLELWKVFLSLENEHLTVEELYKKLRARGWHWDIYLVEDTLAMLVYFGLASVSHLDGVTPRYEHRHLETDQHDHLVCLRCGKVTEFNNVKLEESYKTIGKDLGFFPINHKTVVRGVCKDCLEERKQNLPLEQCSLNETVIVEQVDPKHAGRLSAMGIIPGSQIKILSHSANGVVAAVNGSRLALSKDWCQQITVRQEGASEFCALPLPSDD